MSDDEWRAFDAPNLTSKDGIVTGDSAVDEWERQLRDGTLDVESM